MGRHELVEDFYPTRQKKLRNGANGKVSSALTRRHAGLSRCPWRGRSLYGSLPRGQPCVALDVEQIPNAPYGCRPFSILFPPVCEEWTHHDLLSSVMAHLAGALGPVAWTMLSMFVVVLAATLDPDPTTQSADVVREQDYPVAVVPEESVLKPAEASSSRSSEPAEAIMVAEPILIDDTEPFIPTSQSGLEAHVSPFRTGKLIKTLLFA